MKKDNKQLKSITQLIKWNSIWHWIRQITKNLNWLNSFNSVACDMQHNWLNSSVECFLFAISNVIFGNILSTNLHQMECYCVFYYNKICSWTPYDTHRLLHDSCSNEKKKKTNNGNRRKNKAKKKIKIEQIEKLLKLEKEFEWNWEAAKKL